MPPPAAPPAVLAQAVAAAQQAAAAAAAAAESGDDKKAVRLAKLQAWRAQQGQAAPAAPPPPMPAAPPLPAAPPPAQQAEGLLNEEGDDVEVDPLDAFMAAEVGAARTSAWADACNAMVLLLRTLQAPSCMHGAEACHPHV